MPKHTVWTVFIKRKLERRLRKSGVAVFAALALGTSAGVYLGSRAALAGHRTKANAGWAAMPQGTNPAGRPMVNQD
jgi:hypothetical protein